MGNFTVEEELMMDTQLTVPCWQSRPFKSKEFQSPGVLWLLKEIKKVDQAISRLTLRTWRRELETQLFSSVLTVAPLITKESGWPILWEECWLQPFELMWLLKEFTAEMPQELFLLPSELSDNFYKEFKILRLVKSIQLSKLIFHQIGTKKCMIWSKQNNKKV